MSYKAQALAHEIADKLKIRLSALTLVEGFDTNGNPTITIGAGSPGGKNFFVRVQPISWPLSLNVLGLASEVFTPHVIQFATEANPAGGAGADILTPAELLPFLGETLVRGTKVEWYTSTNGTAPVVGTLVAGNLQASYEASLYFPMQAAQ